MLGVAAQSRERRGGSLFARLSAWLLFWLTSASPGDPTSAPATEHISPGAPHPAALLLLLLLRATAATALGHHLLLDHVDDLVRDAQVLDGAAADVALGHPPEFVASLDVQITSRKLMFIQLSQLTRCPLYVSPFLSSTNTG